jgi:hypothetical protein
LLVHSAIAVCVKILKPLIELFLTYTFKPQLGVKLVYKQHRLLFVEQTAQVLIEVKPDLVHHRLHNLFLFIAFVLFLLLSAFSFSSSLHRSNLTLKLNWRLLLDRLQVN